MNKRSLYTAGLIALVMEACNIPMAAPSPGSDLPASTPDLTADSPTIGAQVGELPDFIVEIVSIDNTTIVRSQEPWTWVQYRVTNIGAIVFPGAVQMQSFSNAEANSGYINVEGPFEPGVPVDGAVAVGSDEYWELGDYTYSITVDYDGQVDEINEENNSSAPITFIVVSP